jgi:hypothetical protein
VAVIYDWVDEYVAHMPGVLAAVNSEGERVQGIAEGIFAKHDHPGGHSIGGGADGITDYYIYLDGPVVHIVEWGRRAYVTQKQQGPIPPNTPIKAWEGTHVMRRTYEAA